MQNHKTCRGCGRDLSTGEFHRNRKNPDGLETRCKSCRAEIARAYREQHRDLLTAQTRRYQQRNRAYFREYNRRRRLEAKEHLTQT